MKNHHHHHHYNHHSPPREPPPPRDPSPASKKPPRPPPLSVSIPDSPPRPEPNPFPNSNSNSNSDESPHSPLRSDSQTAGPIVPVEKYYSPLTSPLPITPPKDPSAPHHVISFNRREEPPPQTAVVKSAATATAGAGGRRRVGFVTSSPAVEEGGGGGGGGGGGRSGVVEKVGLGVRVLEFVFCLISFSVMATDKTQGWSGDSFDRYKEYRFCLTMNVIGFLYSGFQAYDLAYHLATGKHVIAHHLRYRFDFILDQIIAYLLMSASSAAATRVVDWQANWGKDAFTEKASASISMAFLAFFAFALSSLISGYNLCNRDIS